MTTQEILRRMDIDQLNAMQQDTISAFRKTNNLVLLSPTGSGKTLAYLLPLIEALDNQSDRVQAVVLVPSRELAMQTFEVVRRMGNPLRAVAVYGGRPAMEEHRTLNGVRPQLIIGTPGRMLDHLQKENFDATTVNTLIIDEFDKCLELGFLDEMTRVTDRLPNVSRRMLLSATDSPEIPHFVHSDHATHLSYIEADNEADERIQQWLVESPVKDKLQILGDLLCTRGQERSLVFVGYRESVERVANYLRDRGFQVAAFHGGMDQKDRERALYRFAGGSANIMVSTDLAARGLDIPEVDNVVHYHLPIDTQAFIHRNGRTARWDNTGNAFLILGPEEQYATQDMTPWQRPDRLPQPALPRWDTLYIGKGKKDKLSKGDIAGFLMKVAALEKEDVGRIDVRDHYAYVAIARQRMSETLLRVKGQKIKGMKTIIERTR